MMKASLLIIFVVLSMVLLIPGCNADEAANPSKPYLPEARKGPNQKWETRMSNKKSSKSTHNTESSKVHHQGEQNWPGYRNGNGRK